ncbi:MAG: baseplate J/gp47 family protein, partial [Cyanobacteria bacterium J06598_1]
MTFKAKEFDQIVTGMRDRTPSTLTDFAEGSVVRTLYESFSYELALLYEQMERVYLSAFVDTAPGYQLDRVVAILGIQRGEPDYATGLVTFERDLGIDEVIDIPKGFLVTTAEDTEETPKKSFETIEAAALLETEKTVQVRVQAVHRGEGQATAADTIQVMPQPLPGIKAITNEQPVRFVGKQRETDEELRDRAKTALIAASGANTTAIEHALLSMPGVTEVRVVENFHYARGRVEIERHDHRRRAAVTLPKGTELRLTQPTLNRERQFTTLASVTLVGDVVKQQVEVIAQTRGMAGQLLATEIEAETAQWQQAVVAADADSSPDSSPDSSTEEAAAIPNIELDIKSLEPLVLKDFGVIDVFVDGVDFKDEALLAQLHQEIDRVRAAGIYVLLKPAQSVFVDATFQLELVPGKRVSAEARLALEAALQERIIGYLNQQKMGQPLLRSQLTKQLLEPALANDVIKAELVSYRHEGDFWVPSVQSATANRLSVDVLEKIVPRHIRVASETKPLPVDVQVKASSLSAADSQKAETRREIEQIIQDYFGRLAPGQVVSRNALQADLQEKLQDDLAAEVMLLPQFWQPMTAFDGNTVEVSFVEQAQLRNLFIYDRTLNINGALQLVVSLTATAAEKLTLQNQVRVAVETYLGGLKPEENVDLVRMAEVAQAVDGVLQVDWRAEDFQVSLAETAQDITTLPENRIAGTTIQVNPFEKTRLMPAFAIAADIS